MNLTSATQKKINIGILEDDYSFRESLSKYLSSTERFEVKFAHISLSELLLKGYDAQFVDIILLDLHLKDGLCIDNIISIHKIFPFSKIIILTGDDDEMNILNAIENGANGFVHKPVSMHKLSEIIIKVYENTVYFETELVYNLVKLLKRRKLEFLNNTALNLTLKQRQVLKFLKLGKSQKEIAEAMNISNGSVNQHIKNLYRKNNANFNSIEMGFFDIKSSQEKI